MLTTQIPVLGFAARSGTGKTTLLTSLIPIIKNRGLKVGAIKHTHHDFEIDRPGKDSFELRKSGAIQTLLTSNHRWALVTENQNERTSTLDDIISRLDLNTLDIVFIEGYKQETFPKIELHRAELNKPLLYPGDDSIIAIASNEKLPNVGILPLLDINQPEIIADFILQTFFPDKG